MPKPPQAAEMAAGSGTAFTERRSGIWAAVRSAHRGRCASMRSSWQCTVGSCYHARARASQATPKRRRSGARSRARRPSGARAVRPRGAGAERCEAGGMCEANCARRRPSLAPAYQRLCGPEQLCLGRCPVGQEDARASARGLFLPSDARQSQQTRQLSRRSSGE